MWASTCMLTLGPMNQTWTQRTHLCTASLQDVFLFEISSHGSFPRLFKCNENVVHQKCCLVLLHTRGCSLWQSHQIGLCSHCLFSLPSQILMEEWVCAYEICGRGCGKCNQADHQGLSWKTESFCSLDSIFNSLHWGFVWLGLAFLEAGKKKNDIFLFWTLDQDNCSGPIGTL